MQNKEELRRHLLKVRQELSDERRRSGSASICRKIVEWDTFLTSDTVLFYMPIRREVDVRPAIEKAWSFGKTVVLPRALPETREMKLFRVDSFEELQPGAYGILEPLEDEAKAVEPERIRLAVVPGVGFDRRGYRLGYGGGYYDRFFARAGHAVRLGVAYSEQVVATVYPLPHDQPVHYLFTPGETLAF
ncbi:MULTISPECIES: 5-formyltetrahydrofolate cyclo-ligase [Thermoactinomyces]|uniref:5-formyltetrahydrofolate cyclo-ligase n=1 Tax=Thermoactinomyces daqus TaxID=1329516 RepID=A0A7W2AIN1_9BACL|nr:MULTISPECIES: 5-formyltetrahydrofolate cyclo-ligase [Thermoactinomyces]MBA4544437.1 5-formyltetrahydrofolate cyclo-ligase [Thermoactinomyces daqus]MBH8599543.1 5-formyltetrahydrofolate cyclo-ligase [Thermoactinomyces sp. CICC 10523]MBH8605462.1 5-formyltetrahydrofolate cyclo-ligase [Thermoactinomyces sp. CICC 10522]MBH8609180.1 5-formyltetrahydrofolate cyclo-ligase [Thermoactinomyces sp. CICC 10521]